MSRIKSRGNETTEQRMVHAFRQAGITGWRRHQPIRGNPDFVFRPERVAVFVDGCFWHGCERCTRLPKSNVEYWKAKIGRNVARDKRNTRELREKGWRVVRVWEHALAQPTRAVGRVRKALDEARQSSA